MKRRTVSLVLGSGGARGLAHIGVIERLVAAGFEIRSIAGTSMGALVGGIYAAGKLEDYTRWVTALEKLDVIRLLDFSFSGTGLFKGERIIAVLKELIGERRIEELPVTFTAVATDLQTGKEVWLNRGSLFDAIRASIAIPTIVTPYLHDGRQLVDGGLVNPIPIAPTLNDRTDLTIAVNLNGKADPVPRPPAPRRRGAPARNRYHRRIVQFVEALPLKRARRSAEQLGMFEIISRSMETMENTIARLKLAAYSPDVIIEIPRNACAFFEFYRAEELIELGRRRADEALARVRAE